MTTDEVKRLLQQHLPPDTDGAKVLGGLMIDFNDRLVEAEVKIEKLAKFSAFQKETIKQIAEKIGKAAAPAAPAAPSQAAAPQETDDDEPAVFVGPPGMAPPPGMRTVPHAPAPTPPPAPAPTASPAPNGKE